MAGGIVKSGGRAQRSRMSTGQVSSRRVASAKAWNKTKEARFLAALSDTCNVTLAAKLAKVGNSTVYSHRAKDATFRDGWAAAIAQGYARLEIETLERAIRGTFRTIVHKDGREELVTEYSDRVALALLRMHRDTAEAPAKREREEAQYSQEEIEELRAKIMAKLERVRLKKKPPLAIEAPKSKDGETGGGA